MQTVRPFAIFLPLVCCLVLSGQFNRYHPFHILIADDVIASGIPLFR